MTYVYFVFLHHKLDALSRFILSIMKGCRISQKALRKGFLAGSVNVSFGWPFINYYVYFMIHCLYIIVSHCICLPPHKKSPIWLSHSRPRCFWGG